MKNKRIIMYIGVVLILIIIVGVGYMIFNKLKNKKVKVINEYIPEQEITEEQLRQTIVNLYFLDTDTYKLVPEIKEIDSKDLILDPYKTLINLLIEGPQNVKLAKLIPENTKLNNVEIKDGILYLDFSQEFIEGQNLGKEQEELIVQSIVNTVTELTEINQVAFLINGKSDLAYPDNGIVFDKIFKRK